MRFIPACLPICSSISVLLPALFLFAAPAAGAGDPDREPARLQDLVVTATRNELNADRVPASFSVIDRAEIESLPAEDLIDLIGATPGITFNGIGIGGRRTFSIRGMSDSQTLVLVDGRRQIDTNENIGYSDFGNNWVPIEAIERIEIVRGPLSSLWGAEALGGVVNIITRKPGNRWEGSVRVQGALPDKDELGEEFSSWLHASGPVVRDRVGMTLTVEQVRRNNIPAREQPYPGAVIDAREEKKRAGVRSRWNWRLTDNHELTASADYSDEERYTRSWDERRDEPRDYDYDIKRSNLAAEYTGRRGDLDLRARAYRTFIKTRRTYVPQGEESRKEVENRIASWELAYGGLARHLATLGAELRRESLEVPGFNDGLGGAETALHRAVFCQDDFAAAGPLSLTVGVRYDDHEFFGGEWSPRAYAVWDPLCNLQIKGGYGHGFKAPSLKQIHPDYYYEIASMIIVGNPGLKPETADSFELGARWRRRRVEAGATLFTNSIDNLIDNAVIGADGRRNVYQPRNIVEARTRGVEADIAWLPGRGLALDANWTHLDARDLTRDLSLTDRPRNTVNAALTWTGPVRGWTARLRREYRSSQWLEDDGARYRADGYALWHLSLGWEVRDGYELSAGVRNLADEQLDGVSEWFNFYEPGRTFTLGARTGLR